MQCLIGSDIGTSGAKSILFREDGTAVSSAYRAYPVTYPATGGVEQDPEAWWQALKETVREVSRSLEAGERVAALCLATQGGTLCPVDAAGQALGPAIVWSDSRCKEQREELALRVGEEAVRASTGWALGDGLNALQIMRLRQKRPALFRRCARFLSVHDYLSLRLTGRAALDGSNGGINQLLDIRSLQWNAAILDAVGIAAEQLAEVLAPGEAVGRLTPQAARELGLSEDTLLVCGGHDQYCAALGAGAVQPGGRLIGTGTAWTALCVAPGPDTPAGSRISVSRHVCPGAWGKLISLERGGASLAWIAETLGGERSRIPYEELDERCAARGPQAPGLLFFPDTGRRAGAFLGIRGETDGSALARAVMEGVAFEAAYMLEELGGAGEAAVLVSGAAAESSFWMELLAGALQAELRLSGVRHTGCLGAAILAGMGAGVFSSLEEGSRRLIPPFQAAGPGADAGRIREGYEEYRKIRKEWQP